MMAGSSSSLTGVPLFIFVLFMKSFRRVLLIVVLVVFGLAISRRPNDSAESQGLLRPSTATVSFADDDEEQAEQGAELPQDAEGTEGNRPGTKPAALVQDFANVPEGGVNEAIAQLLQQKHDLSDPRVRQQLVEQVRRLEERGHRETALKAKLHDYPLRTDDGAVLVGFEGDHPLYDQDHNAQAAISTGANLVHAAPFNITGSGFDIGLWEAGDVPRITHNQFGGRVIVVDGATSTDTHAAHVAGTLIASGTGNAALKGMAPSATVRAHDTSSEISEMIALAASAAAEPGKIYISNHSYGYAVGWNDSGTAWYGSFTDDGNPTNDSAFRFGRYGSIASSWDSISWNAPYYLIFKSAGNDRNDNAPTSGTTWKLNNSSSFSYSYDALSHPVADYSWMTDGATTGFGTVGERTVAKNIVAIGSVADAVSSGVRDIGRASLDSFSSAGPTDDGRIKPDLVANGNILLSADDASDSATAMLSGTSMASPNASGSALLLVDYYESLYPGQAMLASTLKGLLLHTADDLGNPGPDYRFGWGLMNVKAAADLIQDHAAQGDASRLVEGELDGANADDEVVVNLDGTESLRVTICWTDPPASSTSLHDNRTAKLVHDLNLTVTGPGGTHLPYVMPFVGDWSESKLDDDAVNGVNDVDNVEQVYLETPGAGAYTIRVDHAGALSQGSQKYSLIVSGAAISEGGPVVVVENPVADQRYLGDSPAVIPEVADVNDVFSDTGHTYGISYSPIGILAATLQGDGTVDVTPTMALFGTVTVTLTAADAGSNEAEHSFDITIAPETMFVDASTPAAQGAQDGFTWATAYEHLNDALDVALDGQDIWVAAGTYHPNMRNGQAAGDATESFVIPAGVSLYGGFTSGDSNKSDADPFDSGHATHLSGDLSGNDGALPGSYADGLSIIFTTENSNRIVDLSASGPNDAFDGFVVSGSYGAGSNGGGIYSDGGSATISRSLISGNYVALQGAGIYLKDGSPKVVRCLIFGNRASSLGGGLWLQGATATVLNCEFRGNEASGGAGVGVDGGGTLTLGNSLISGGKGGFSGNGGIQIQSGLVEIVNCTITSNYCSAFGGGGILVTSATPPFLLSTTVRNTIIWNNRAGGTTTDARSSVYYGTSTAPQFYSCLIANSRSNQGVWWTAIGQDMGWNTDGDPLMPSNPNLNAFPSPVPTEDGDFSIPANSPALNSGDDLYVLTDSLDLDGDGDMGESLPFDLAMASRQASLQVDQGAYEFGDLTVLDVDDDGISDAFELAHSGNVLDLNPFVDSDGDGLTSLSEFAHGLDPAKGLTEPVGQVARYDQSGEDYMTVTYEVNETALTFVRVVVERRTDLEDPYGWKEDETVLVSSDPIVEKPGMRRVVERSITPLGNNRYEFFRLKTERLSE